MELSKRIIFEFMKAKRIKRIDELTNYSFHEIYDRKELSEFGNRKTYEDGDCTRLAYAIDWIIWGKDLKNLIPDYTEEKLFNEIDFSGDTICTFNTLFGSTEEIYSDVISRLELENTDLKEKIENFRILYQTIGNFSLLPNHSCNGQTLNKYRGQYWGWKDYFDTFLVALNSVFKKECENHFFCDIVNENSFFFQKYDSVEKYCSLFSLDANFRLSGRHFNHNMLKTGVEEEYKKFVIEYIEKSTSFINMRSQILIAKLKENLRKISFPEEYLD